MKKILLCISFLLFAGVFIFSNESDSNKDTSKQEEIDSFKQEEIEQKALSKMAVSQWVNKNFSSYFQKYSLSCEAAIVRLTCASLGIDGLTEDEILKLFPVHKSDPALGLVIREIDGKTFKAGGGIDWENYGAHAEVVKIVVDKILAREGLSGLYYTEIRKLTNPQLRKAIKEEAAIRGAIIWVAADVRGKKPQKNKLGQVLGEHVQFVAPLLDSSSRMLVYDVWPWKGLPFRLFNPLNRDMFDYKTVIIKVKPANLE